ncbi:hypothetical protein [Fulvimarina sp. MAC3]|uniref:hypothetical protein n=1 Tax=Fulvimarina sp. MAC3 TaxID=3148887 RepID=UPI0031FDEA6A
MARTFSLIVIALAGLSSLSACVSAGSGDVSPQTLAERWTGKPVDDFFAQYGSPFAEYGQRGGGVRYTWRKRYTAPSAAGADAPEVRVCEIDLLTDASDRIRSIGATRNSKIRADETPSCDGAFRSDAA